eukprot:COSAG01_NODE_446_length_16939_cov_19.753518_16_plen_121_part_00
MGSEHGCGGASIGGGRHGGGISGLAQITLNEGDPSVCRSSCTQEQEWQRRWQRQCRTPPSADLLPAAPTTHAAVSIWPHVGYLGSAAAARVPSAGRFTNRECLPDAGCRTHLLWCASPAS